MANSYCSHLSEESGESLYGTLKPVKVWLLIENNQAWERAYNGEKDTYEGAVSGSLKFDERFQHLQTYQQVVPQSRILFIRQSRQSYIQERMGFFVAIDDENGARLYRGSMSEYTDFTLEHFEAIVRGEAVHVSEEPLLQVDEKIYLVCTNGRHDRCCGTYGVPVYNAMSKVAPDSVWQCSHIGGHRFAATVLCFPHGINYGRITPDNAAGVVDSFQNNTLLLDHYRARACYPQAVQAAEYFIRKHHGLLDVEPFELIQSQSDGDVWSIGFRSGEGYEYRVRIKQGSRDVIATCGDEKPKSQSVFQLVK